MECKKHCTEVSFIAGSRIGAAVIATHDRPDLSSTALKRVTEGLDQRLPQLLMLEVA
jgi:hypothetical protein